MNLGLLLQTQGLQPFGIEQDLAACNKASAPHGLSLTPEQVYALAERRVEALRETQRVEFGRGILVELVTAFASSPYLTAENYDSTLAELQDIFYHLKEESEEQVPDNELIDAMRHLFDNETHGVTETLETLSAAKLLATVKMARQDANEDWSEADAYYQNTDDAEIKPRDEVDRVFGREAWERASNEYAATFYDGAREVYRITADMNGRIGGSSLGR